MMSNREKIKQLHHDRSRAWFVIWSVRVILAMMVASWLFGGFLPTSLLDERNTTNAKRLAGEMVPFPLQQDRGNVSEAVSWAWDLWRNQGQEAVLTTLSISVVAMMLAGLIGVVLSIPAARNLMQVHPFLRGGNRSAWGLRLGFASIVYSTRLVLIFLRAVPEYVWAFLLLGMLGPTAWPMVLALGLHNAGILGKLNAEVLENCDQRAASAWRSTGASRWSILLGALVPQVLSRLLLYFFYRWETCVREATVLGMLGMASLGFYISDSRARNHYDTMFFFILCGVLMVFVGDWLSNLVRRKLRES